MHKLLTIIVAGGSGSRMGADVPKQFLLLDNKAILMHTIEAYAAAVDEYNDRCVMDVNKIVNNFVVVLPACEIKRWETICDRSSDCSPHFPIPHTVVAGGATRWQSVHAAIAAVTTDVVVAGGEYDLVAVHDGVRPFVGVEVFADALNSAMRHGSGIPAVAVTDSIRQLTFADLRKHSDAHIDTNIDAVEASIAIDRRWLRAVQTPQIFNATNFFQAYSLPESPDFTDDASVVEKAGSPIALTTGDSRNIKITTPLDLALAELMLHSAFTKQQ